MAVRVALFRARALRNQGFAGDEGGAILLGGPAECCGHLGVVVTIDGLDRPAIGLEPRQLITGFRDGCNTVDGGIVVIK